MKVRENTQQKRCGEEMDIYSRVVGFYSRVNGWNKGKTEEFRKRKTFKMRTDRDGRKEDVDKGTVERD